ncbi:hypothetical protein V8C34DRAFT_271936 [Trichoderma compactum]
MPSLSFLSFCLVFWQHHRASMTHATTQRLGSLALHVFIPIPLPNACLVRKCIGNFFLPAAMMPSPAPTAACLLQEYPRPRE